MKNTSTSYGSVAKFFHWSVFVLVTSLLVIGVSFDFLPEAPITGTVYNVHKIIGLGVFVLMLLRVGWTLINPKPELPGAKAWEKMLERAGHRLLYVLLVAMPISGWVMATAAGKLPHIGSVSFGAPWVPLAKPLAKLASGFHYYLAWTLFVMVCLHVVAAFRHHFVNKDDVLKRMMPRGR